MKRILLAISILLMSCSERQQWMQDLEPPIIVVGTGSFMTDCVITVKDKNGIIKRSTDNGLCTAEVGDTLIN